MNNRHIQTFLTVSAAFFAMNAPLHANAGSNGSANAIARSVQCAPCTKTHVGAIEGAKAERQS